VLRVGRGPESVTQDEINWELESADFVKSFRHPNIVKILSIATDQPWRNIPGAVANYIQMELGQTDLQHFISLKKKGDGGALSLQQYFSVLIDVLSGLAFLHEKHVIHRDIKAANSALFLLPD
jgi:serine/threonine protein kinase